MHEQELQPSFKLFKEQWDIKITYMYLVCTGAPDKTES